MRETWTDYRGKVWPVTSMRGRLKFKLPSHAALRAHVFHRDGYSCRRCPAKVVDVPNDYDGRYTIFTDTLAGSRRDVLVVDHVLTLPAGGLNRVENFQTLCQTCNRRKQREDKAATARRNG